jgi:hypothetical protein
MKAEQRKELETNTLADKMGHVMQRVKSSPRRTFVTYAIIVVGVLIAAYLGYRWWTQDVILRSEQWIRFYDGASGQLGLLVEAGEKDSKETTVGKAALLQIAWYFYWEEGVKMIGINPRGAMFKLQQSKQIYEKVLRECKDKDEPTLEAQAMLGRAVCTESLSGQDNANLDKAKDYYKELANHEKYGSQAEGQFAKERLKAFEDKAQGPALREAYFELKLMLNVPAEDRRPADKGKDMPFLNK